MNRVREWRRIQRDAQREIGNRAYAIYRQPWRVLHNRRLRAEIRAIMAVVDPEGMNAAHPDVTDGTRTQRED